MGTTPVRTDLDMLSTNRITNLLDGVANQEPATVAQLNALLQGLAWKDNARVATQSNLSIASPGATIDGITMATNDRVLVRAQSTGTENGIYVWNGAAVAMTRSTDADVFAELESAVITVDEGTSAGATYRQTAVNGTIGSTTVTWNSFGTAAPSASETTAGVAELATQGETDTGTDDLRIVTPLKLATWSNRKLKFSQTFGDGAATSYTITHNLNTTDVHVSVWETGGSKRQVICEIQATSTTQVTIIATPAPASNSLRAVVLG